MSLAATSGRRKRSTTRRSPTTPRPSGSTPQYFWAYTGRGDAWHRKKEYDKAIADFTEAIRLEPNVGAYYNRGKAWSTKKEHDKANADFDAAIRFDPKDAWGFNNRGRVWLAKKDYEKAIADYDAAIRLDPKYASAHFNRSVTEMLTRRGDVVQGFRQVIDVDGWKGGWAVYAVILGHMAARQSGDEPATKAFLNDAAGKLDATAWPHPVVEFLRGEIGEPALLALAVDDDKRTEAHCFLGLDFALRKHKDKARAHYQWVKEHGNTRFVEYTIALAELDRLAELYAPAKPIAP